MIASIESSVHYSWGQNCYGWHLFRSDSLSITQQRMPMGTGEALHFHQKAQQFFFILSGLATFEIDGKVIEVKATEGLHIAPTQKHSIKNNSESEHGIRLNYII